MCHKRHFLSVNGSSNRDIPYNEDIGMMDAERLMMESRRRRGEKIEA